MPKIKVRDINIHYLAVGHGPDVVMLHGFLGNQAVWHLNMVPNLRRDFRLTSYDLRGHGYTEMTPTGYTSEEMALDLKGFLDALGIEKPVLVGHSYGADACLYFAYMYPDRVDRVIALEPGLAALVDQRKDKEWIGWSYWVSKLEEAGLSVPHDKRSDVDYLLNLTLETKKIFGPARGLPRNRGPLLDLLKKTTLMQDYEVVGVLTLDAVREIRTPVFLIYGEKSHFLGSHEFLREALPNCRSALLPGGEHFGPLEQPELLTKHIREYLTGADGLAPEASGQLACEGRANS
jgi:pimeloyl-ACP methyl ester carboxylesterase